MMMTKKGRGGVFAWPMNLGVNSPLRRTAVGFVQLTAILLSVAYIHPQTIDIDYSVPFIIIIIITITIARMNNFEKL